MELSELSRIVNQDGAPRETSRTIKPADRCVISYNFQQTHSHNYTHNLLIGMFGTTNKKINKNASQLSIEPPKSKLVSLASHPKRIYRQDPSSIVKVYNNQIDPKKYVNQFSGRREKTENRTYHQPTEKSEYEDSKIKNQRDTFFEKTNEDLTIQDGTSFREPFNEVMDRRKSPYHSKNKKKTDLRIKQNSIEGGNNENQSPVVLPSRSFEEKDKLLHGRGKQNSGYSSKSNQSHSVQDPREGKKLTHHSTSSNKFGKGPAKDSKRNLHFYGKNSQNSQQSPQSLTHVSKYNLQIFPNGNHLKKVTQNQLEVNQRESKYQQKASKNQQNSELLQEATDHHPEMFTTKYNEEGEIEGRHSKDSSFQVKKSRKQIQDDQMRQIEQKYRRDESKQFKKGYFKILHNNSKEFLPFNVDLEPVMHISKKKGRTDGSTTKTTLYKESSKKMVEKEQLRLGNMNKRPQNSISGQVVSGNNTGSTKPSFYKEKGGNKQTSIGNFRSDQKIISNHKARSPKPKESYTNSNLNQIPGSKFKQQNRELALEKQRNGINELAKPKLDSRGIKDQAGNKINGNSFNIKRQEKSQNKQKMVEGYHNEVEKEDITANNQIRGYKISEKSSSKQGLSLYKDKGETNLNYSNNLGPSVNRSIQKTNPIQKQSIAGFKQGISQNQVLDSLNTIQRAHRLNQTHKRNKSNPNKNEKNGGKDEINENDKSHHRSRHASVSSSRSSHEKSAKMNTEDYRASKSHSGSNRDSEDYPRLRKNASKERSLSKSKLADSTAPRQPKEKDRKFKDWKKSDIEKQRKESRKFKPFSNSNKKSSMSSLEKSKEGKKSRRSNMLNEIDLDAEEEDPFGLSAQKNVTGLQRKSTRNGKKDKKMRPSVFKQEKEGKNDGGQQIEEDPKEDRRESHSSHVSSNSDKSSHHSHSSQKYEKLNDAQIVPLSHLNENGQIDFEAVSETKNAHKTPIFAGSPDFSVLPNNEQPKKQGVEQIQQFIQENGSQISSIDDEGSMVAQKAETKYQNSISEKEKQKQSSFNQFQIIVTPECVNQEANLQDLLIATEEVHQNQKQLEPILNNVEVQLGQSPLDQENQEVKANPVKKQSEKEKQNEEEPDMAVNLPHITLQNIRPEELVSSMNNKSPRLAAEAQSDYHDEQMDEIVDILPENAKEHNRSSDFFQCNLNQTSKLSDPNQTINYTRYQVIDKDTTNYSRAPILSFLYQVSKDDSFSPSSTPQLLLKRIKHISQINEEIIDQAVNTLLSIDPWIIERIFEPFEDTEGKIGVWLYCYGVWKLFLENKKNNFRIILRQVVNKAIRLIDEKYELEAVIKLISGVRVIRLKSGKKRIFNELQYSLRKGHVIKAYTSSETKWKGKVFEVAKVETTRQNENVLQIRQGNDTYWVREEKFQQIFEHFLLICTRNSHFWTNRSLQPKQAHKTVLTMTSHVPSHGSLTLFYPSNQKSSLLLYKELDSKVLKYMGKIEQKANQNGNLYFQFRLHGTYSLFLETPASCLLAIESTTPLEIGMPEYVLRETLRNEECEYVELSQNRPKGWDKEPLRGNATLQKLRDTFIRMVVKK